ncbi:hypothetical protein C7S18_21120 [Ahniella affigens]|uniref:IPTL-CTERM protein sorting domain-containing protein n=1 Tax=Ahniella affigens TaxID=2021234 RepID=A0A2P1PXF6_9GAMM|nr:hypothetical protein [Ahniella affigens]AVP99520.1 hypothetical protein C7S18_21120 [Ahniella affigens]
MRLLTQTGLLLALLTLADVTVAAAVKLGAPLPGTPRDPHGSTIVADPSFESGTPNPVWSESSTNFDTPLCTVDACGTGNSAQPVNTGDWWVWFGGIDADETGEVAQTVTLPSADVLKLNFAFQAPVCSGAATDFVEARINGTTVWRAHGAGPLCGIGTGYTPISVDISQFSGQTVTLAFFSIISGGKGPSAVLGTDACNFFIDDVSVGTSSFVPALSSWALLAAVMLLGVIGLVGLRRFR